MNKDIQHILQGFLYGAGRTAQEFGLGRLFGQVYFLLLFSKEPLTLDSIAEDMQNRVKDGIEVSPATWIDGAVKIHALSWEIDEKLVLLESDMAKEEARLIAEGETASKAKILKTRCIDYKNYLSLKARKEWVKELILLAKRRSITPDI